MIEGADDSPFPADYLRQPWKNGKGTTTELWRHSRDGQMLARLSRATVAKDGPFSLFSDVDRNLTVLTGPGFRLTGPGIDLACLPLQPVAFPGDVTVVATGTGGTASTDFNVMTARDLVTAEVAVARDTALPAGGRLALYALGPARIDGQDLPPDHLALTDNAVQVDGGPVLAIRLLGL
ncbi:MAG: HutD family protein [Paracoccaceae bacterium]